MQRTCSKILKNMYFYAYAPRKSLEFLERTGAARSKNNQGNTQKNKTKKKQNEKTKRKNQGHTINQIIRTTKNKTKKPETRNLI